MNKKEVKTIEDLEKYYSKCRKIKFANEIKPNNIEEIFDLIKKNQKATYFKTGTVHCYNHRMRSIDDYINLCKFYFPETTISEIIKTVKNKILEKPEGQSVNINYCPNIKKDNIRYSYYNNPEVELKRFENKSFRGQGFINCQVQYNNNHFKING